MKQTKASVYRDEVLHEFINQIFTFPVSVGSIETDLGSYATFIFKKPHEQDDLLGTKMSVKSDPIKIYGTESFEVENFFEDGVKYFSLYDFLMKRWIIVNVSTKEEIVCSGPFGLNYEGKGVTAIVTNSDSIKTWQQLKDHKWKSK